MNVASVVPVSVRLTVPAMTAGLPLALIATVPSSAASVNVSVIDVTLPLAVNTIVPANVAVSTVVPPVTIQAGNEPALSESAFKFPATTNPSR